MDKLNKTEQFRLVRYNYDNCIKVNKEYCRVMMEIGDYSHLVNRGLDVYFVIMILLNVYCLYITFFIELPINMKVIYLIIYFAHTFMLTLVIFTFADVTSSNAMMAHKLTEYFHFNIRNKKISLSSKAKVKYFSK